MLRCLLEMLQKVVDVAAGVDFADRGAAMRPRLINAPSIVVEDLDQLCEDSSLIKKTLDSHLDLKLTGGFETETDLLTHTIHDQLWYLQLCLVQVDQI